MHVFFFLPLLLVLHAGFWVRNIWTQRGCGQGKRKVTWHRGRRPQNRGACSHIFSSMYFFSLSLFSLLCVYFSRVLCVCLCIWDYYTILSSHQLKLFQFSSIPFPRLLSWITSTFLSVRDFACCTLSLFLISFLCSFLVLFWFVWTWLSPLQEITTKKKTKTKTALGSAGNKVWRFCSLVKKTMMIKKKKLYIKIQSFQVVLFSSMAIWCWVSPSWWPFKASAETYQLPWSITPSIYEPR